MTREVISLTLPDVSAFARQLRADLGADAPGHQSLMNAIARAGGYRNFQHLKATQADTPAGPVDGRALSRALEWFDADGRMTNWPAKRKIRALCLWVIWAQIPPRTEFTERTISDHLNSLTTFRDAAQIRRSLVEDGVLRRNPDGSCYQRCEKSPDATAQALIRTILARAKIPA